MNPIMISALVALAATPAFGSTVLFQGAGAQLPGAQGFLYVTNPPFGAKALQDATGGVTTLDTTADITESAGYFTHNPITGDKVHLATPALDRAAGFTLSFDLAILAENHGTNVNRGGFSVIAVTSDRKAIELAFWTTEIWAYNFNGADFTHGEGVARDPSLLDDLTRYDLVVQGNDYTLKVGGSSILTGSLRDYTAWPGVNLGLLGTLDPYDKPGMIFFGDDTSQASSKSQLSYIAVGLVPEPATLTLLGLGAACVAGRRR